MKIKMAVLLNIKSPKEIESIIDKATEKAIKDVVTDIAEEVISNSPHVTGNNMRSIKFEVGPGKEIAQRKLEGAVYSTSGYGGYLETGTSTMAAQPYFKPALDRNLHKLPKGIKANLK